MIKREVLKKNIGLAGLYLYGFSLMVSKSGINIGMGLMLIGSLFFLKKFNLKKMDNSLKYLLVIIVLIPVVDFLSLGGLESAKITLEKSYRFLPVFLIPIFLKDMNILKKFMFSIVLSILVNCIYGLYIFKINNWNLNMRYLSFTDIMNSAHCLTALSFIVLSFGIILYKEGRKKTSFFIWIIYSLNVICIILGQTRGSWLAFIGVFILFIIFNLNKKIIAIISIALMCGGIYASNNKTVKEIYISRGKSIFNVKSASPNIRIIMWKSAIEIYKENPIFGTGKDNSSKYYLKVVSQNKGYNKLHYIENLKDVARAGNPHNMYVNAIAEMGSFAFILFIYFAYLFIEQIKLLLKTKKESLDRWIISASVGLFSSFLISGLTENVFNNFIKRNILYLSIVIFIFIKNKSEKNY